LTKTDLLIINAKQLICPSDDENKKPELKIIENGAIACSQGKIVAAGHSTEITEKFQAKDVFDATGKVVAPGFVDPHTHPVFFGTREDEFELRNSGKSYADIAKAGGGIRFSVRQLRQASKEQLIEHALPYLDQFIKNGTTTIEAKSGYGLTFNDEIKSLEVIRELNKIHPIDLVPTFLGAHEIPDEYRDRKQEYIKIVTEEMIPHVAEEGLAEFCDIFCESHVYNTDDTELILTAARKAGLKLKIHSDQLSSGGGTEIAAQLGAVSADHLDHVNSESIQSLKGIARGTGNRFQPGQLHDPVHAIDDDAGVDLYGNEAGRSLVSSNGSCCPRHFKK